MIKLSACIEMLFNEHKDFYDRFEAAKKAGLDAVEFWDWTGKDIERIKKLAEANELKIAALCVSSADPEFNSKKLVCREAIPAFVKACEETVEKAAYLGAGAVIVTVGNERNDITRAEQHTNIVLALKAAAPVFEKAGITLVVEPLNILVNHKGYYLSSSYEGFGIIEEVGSPRIKLLYDVYHQQITEGNLAANIAKYKGLVGHFHIADVPGRNEPGSGEINYSRIFRAIEETGYTGYVGMEYRSVSPSAVSAASVLELAKKI